MQIRLDEFKIGQSGEVVRLNAEGKIRRRLFDMGITPGASVILHKVAPLGDPIQVTIRGYELSLRKEEASAVVMEVQE